MTSPSAVNSRRASARAGRRRVFLLLLAALAVLGLADWFSDGLTRDWWFGTGTLSVSSAPPGARVVIDGAPRGVTPLTINLRSGDHALLLKHPWHKDLTRTLTLEQDQALELRETLPAAYGALALASNPRGATVRINGELQAGLTPLVINPIIAGRHQIELRLPKRETLMIEVEVLPGQTVELARDLAPARLGTVRVVSTPRQARARLRDADGAEHATDVPLPYGRYTLTVNAPGHHAVEQTVLVNAAEKTLTIVLQPVTGTLLVQVQPSSASITVNRPGARTEVYRSGVSYPAGPVTIEARAPGFRTQRRTVHIEDGQRVVNIALKAVSGQAGDRIRDALPGGHLAPEAIVVPAGQISTSGGGQNVRRIRGVRFEYPFAMSVTEITRGEWRVFANATGRSTPNPREGETDQHPISRIRFDEAVAYADWLTQATGAIWRVPSEAEWEYAARAGDSNEFAGGESAGGDPAGGTASAICTYGNVADRTAAGVFRAWDTIDCDDGALRPVQVGRYQANAWGLKDMIGNVAEWTSTCWDSAPGTPDDPDTDCGSRVVRGGSWDSTATNVGYSDGEFANREGDDRGLRLLREL
ncbi:MAG: SUMF1/EgtB/PvdO family nonheme iron enzyme [Pseudomonadales bacterium]